MTQIVVVYHSGYGHTRRVAEYVAEGAKGELLAIDAEGNLPEGGWDKLAAADAIVFGSPTYMGGASWQFKKFADASSKPWYGRVWQDKVFGGFTNSASMNGDKQVTLIGLQTLASQHGGIWVSSVCCRATARQQRAPTSTIWAVRSVCLSSRHRMPPSMKSRRATLIRQSVTASASPR